MSIVDIIILAIALSIDACVVSFSNGLIFTQNKRTNSLMLAFSVGLFQFLMPVIGFFAAQTVSKYLEPYAPWIVFGIFTAVGLKFIKDSFENKKEEKINCYLCFKYILLVSIATSIDALGAGVSIAFTGVNDLTFERYTLPISGMAQILFPAIVIGIVTFINSLIGFWSGYLFKKFPTKNLEITGGVILILLAFKVLFESF